MLRACCELAASLCCELAASLCCELREDVGHDAAAPHVVDLGRRVQPQNERDAPLSAVLPADDQRDFLARPRIPVQPQEVELLVTLEPESSSCHAGGQLAGEH